MSVDGIILWLLILLVNYVAMLLVVCQLSRDFIGYIIQLGNIFRIKTLLQQTAQVYHPFFGLRTVLSMMFLSVSNNKFPKEFKSVMLNFVTCS